MTFLVPFLIGIAFGFTLESSGFGDARRLAAQFYFTELRVLKVMFTAIITAMVLLALFAAFGWVDLDRIWVNPTYLGSGILGGIVLGLGFIIGGYCPGTSIVSAATLKIDGTIFLVGVGLGGFVFGETADSFRVFSDTAGAMGRVTLPEWLGLPYGLVVLLVVLMALGMFWGSELLERRFGSASTEVPGSRDARLPAVLRGGRVVLVPILLIALVLPLMGQPSLDEQIAAQRVDTDRILASRDVHLDPLEVLGLVHDHVQGRPGRFRLDVIDVRDESDFNLFHLAESRRVPLERLRGDAGRAETRPDQAEVIKVLVSNDEQAAEAGWRILHALGAKHVYVLAGGVNRWLDEFRDGLTREEGRPAVGAPDELRHAFPSARGDRYPFARPPAPVWKRLVGAASPPPAWKVEPPVEAPAATGGCG